MKRRSLFLSLMLFTAFPLSLNITSCNETQKFQYTLDVTIVNSKLEINQTTNFHLYLIDQENKKEEISDLSKINIEYDKEYLKINNYTIKALKEGKTIITFTHTEYGIQNQKEINIKKHEIPKEESLLATFNVDTCTNLSSASKDINNGIYLLESTNDTLNDVTITYSTDVGLGTGSNINTIQVRKLTTENFVITSDKCLFSKIIITSTKDCRYDKVFGTFETLFGEENVKDETTFEGDDYITITSNYTSSTTVNQITLNNTSERAIYVSNIEVYGYR